MFKSIMEFFITKEYRAGFHMERNGCFWVESKVAVRESIKYFKSRKYNPTKNFKLR